MVLGAGWVVHTSGDPPFLLGAPLCAPPEWGNPPSAATRILLETAPRTTSARASLLRALACHFATLNAWVKGHTSGAPPSILGTPLILPLSGRFTPRRSVGGQTTPVRISTDCGDDHSFCSGHQDDDLDGSDLLKHVRTEHQEPTALLP